MAITKSPVKKAIELLRDSTISLEERNELYTAILDKVEALPLYDIISADPNSGSILLNNKPASLEDCKRLREGALAILNNYAFKFIHEQVIFESIKSGFVNSSSEGQSLTGKAAYWFGQQQLKHLITLAGLNDGKEE